MNWSYLYLPMIENHTPTPALKKRQNRLKWTLLVVWFFASFGPGVFAHNLTLEIKGWPLYFWLSAQGSLLIFIGIVAIYAWLMNRWEAEEIANLDPSSTPPHEANSQHTGHP